MSRKVKPDRTYWLENKRARLKKLEEHRNDPWNKLSRMFGDRTKKTLREVMHRYKIPRDRDKAPNRTKLPTKWTPERIADLREHRNDDWPIMKARYECSQGRIERIMSVEGIRRDRVEQTVWTDEHERILVKATLQSHLLAPHTVEGRRGLKKLWLDTTAELKAAGFEGSVKRNSLHKHLESITQDRLTALDIQHATAPLHWGMSEEAYATAKAAAVATAGASDPPEAPKIWWLRLTPEQGQEFLADFRSDFRLPGHTNADHCDKWSRKVGDSVSEHSLGKAARHFGETKNRVQIAQTYKTASQIKIDIKKRLAELVGIGALVDRGADGLYEDLCREFADEMARSHFQFPKEEFLPLLNEVVWTDGPKGTLALLNDVVRQRGSVAEKFHQYHRYIPLDMVEQKAEWLRGITNRLIEQKLPASPTLPGVNRFIGEEGLDERDKDFELPPATFSAPFTIPVLGKNWDILVINGANIGLEHTPIIEENVVRLALAEAAHRKVDAVLILNTIDINTKKAAGPSRVVEAFFSGVDVSPKVLDPDYLQRVRDILDANPKDKVIYVTRQETSKNVMLGWQKIFWRPDNPKKPTKAVPEYSGPIYIVFGVREAQYISAAAYWEIHRINLIEQSEVRTELAAVEGAYVKAFKRLTTLEINRIRFAARLEENPDDEAAIAKLAEITRETESLAEEAARLKQRSAELNALKNRTIITNVSDPDLKRFHQMALGHTVRLFEKIAPESCKVVGMGDTCFQIGQQKVGVHIPGHIRITDTLLADFNSTYGPKVIRQEMPDLTIIGHPYPLNQRGGAREVDAKGQRGSAQICVAPMCADDRILRAKLRHIVEKSRHPVGRAVFNEQCATGVLLVSCINGIVSTDHLRLSALGAHERRKKAKSTNPAVAEKNIIIEIDTDIHIGNRNRQWTWLKSRGIRHGVSEAVCHLFREAGFLRPDRTPPINCLAILDDPIHGDHFNQHRQPHQQQMPYGLYQDELNRLYEKIKRTRNQDKKNELLDEARLLSLEQDSLKGIPWLSDQVEAFLEEFLEPNVDFFDGLLRRVLQSGLIFRGVSELTPGVRYDRRDIGAVNIFTGNHGIKSTLGHFAEGRTLRHFLRLLMMSYPHWRDKSADLRKLIASPLYGSSAVGYGTVQAPGGYTYGLDFRGTPPSSSTDWSDPLLMAGRITMRRGNISRIHELMMTLEAYGDKHFETYLITADRIKAMGPPDTPTDSFAEWAGGFPPNNTGVVFVCLPAEGPDAGPILIRPLLFDHIKRFIDNHEIPDFDKFLPKPL